jgi:hypothetical protein
MSISDKQEMEGLCNLDIDIFNKDVFYEEPKSSKPFYEID